MKKYVKPALFSERFQLTEMIAGPCGTITNLKDSGCEVTEKDYVGGPFTKNPDCQMILNVGADLPIQGYCYWNGEKDSTWHIFTS